MEECDDEERTYIGTCNRHCADVRNVIQASVYAQRGSRNPDGGPQQKSCSCKKIQSDMKEQRPGKCGAQISHHHGAQLVTLSFHTIELTKRFKHAREDQIIK